MTCSLVFGHSFFCDLLGLLGERAFVPRAMGQYHEGPTRSCPIEAYYLGRGLHPPGRSSARGSQSRPPRSPEHARRGVTGHAIRPRSGFGLTAGMGVWEDPGV